MTTASLVFWIAAVAGVELALRGALGAGAGLHVAGLMLLVGVFGVGAWTARQRQLPRVARAALVTAIALAALAAAEGLASARSGAPTTAAPEPRFDAAQGDPEAYRAWYAADAASWRALEGDAPPDGSALELFGRPVVRGRRGWRERISGRPAPERFRILVLGDGRTFGALRSDGERPWPDVLEALVETRLRCRVPVEVINGGRPGDDVARSAALLAQVRARLAPDLVLVHHGPGEFTALLDAVPGLDPGPAPALPRRGSWLLGSLERRLRGRPFEARWVSARFAAPERGALAKAATAEHYRALVRTAAPAEVVLTTFPLGVDLETPEEVFRFYELAVPDARRYALANRLHERLVPGIAGATSAEAIDVGAGLDGAWRDAYLHPIHLDQRGRDRLARNALDGLLPRLERQPRPGCSPRNTLTRPHG